MDIYGDCYTGDPFCVQFAPDQIGDEAYIAEIVQRICSLRPLFEEFVVVDLIKKDGDADRPAFFQTTRDRAFYPSPEKRYLFCVEIGIPGIEGKRKGTWLYGAKNPICGNGSAANIFSAKKRQKKSAAKNVLSNDAK